MYRNVSHNTGNLIIKYAVWKEGDKIELIVQYLFIINAVGC